MRIILLLAISLFFNGCTEPKCEPKKIYIKTKVPRLKTLNKIQPYQIKDFSVLDDTYYKVNIKQLHGASTASQKRIHKIDFYERQIYKFNKEFTGEQNRKR